MPRHISRRDLFTRVAPAAAAGIAGSTLAAARVSFIHGVASGDPVQDRVIIWTRVTPSEQTDLLVRWEVAQDRQFQRVVAKGEARTGKDRDFTVKVDVSGLVPGRGYFYRFSAGEALSPVGRTRTLPAGSTESFKLGVCSCSNYPAGYFNAYRDMAERGDLDVVLHLGDYIYEYERDGYASEDARRLGRQSSPGHETVSLRDYRARHAQYKSDPDLQKLHAAVPFILSWDDHEFTNDAWLDGAQNHNDGEGDWAERKGAAMRAYYEWMPIREPLGRQPDQQWRSFEIGDLATLVMLETRLSARERQPDFARDLVWHSIAFDVTEPSRPRRIDDHAEPSADRQIERYRQPFDLRTDEPEPITDYQRVVALAQLDELPDGFGYLPDMPRFIEDVLNAPDRQLLGRAQRNFIEQALTASKAARKRWQLLGNQTLLTPSMAPNLAEALTPEQKDALPDYFKPFVELTRFAPPLGLDNWNGYGAERDWLLDVNAELGTNLVVLTGDTHANWGFSLKSNGQGDSANEGQWQGVELGTTSISSPGFTETLGIAGAKIESLLKGANPTLHYSEVAHRGYLILTLTDSSASAEFHRISTVSQRQYQSVGSSEFQLEPSNAGGGVTWRNG